MPLKTFFNLEQQRQDEIINICYEEFAQNDFESASLSRIIKKLGLAKGSFYRYFENKKDLYLYLAEFALEIVSKEYDKHFSDENTDFFTAWLDISIASLQWEDRYPLYLRFLNKTKNDPISAELGITEYRKVENRIDRISESLSLHQKKGEIRDDIDLEVLSLFVIYSREAFHEYCRLKERARSHRETSISFSRIGEKEIINDLSKFVTLFRDGIGKK